MVRWLQQATEDAVAAALAEVDSDAPSLEVLSKHAKELDRALIRSARRRDDIEAEGLLPTYEAVKRRAEIWQLPLRRAGASSKPSRQQANMDRLRRLAQLERER